MCCQTLIHGVSIFDPSVHAVLAAAGMTRSTTSPSWVRRFSQDKNVVAGEGLSGVGLILSIHPSIGNHTEENHRVDALLAAFVFELAARLGERFETKVIQRQLVGVCEEEVDRELAVIHPTAAHPSVVIAHYPHHPMKMEYICYGFRAVLLGGVYQYVTDDDEKRWLAAISDDVPAREKLFDVRE